MSSKFYESVIEEEQKAFDVSEIKLNAALKNVGRAYSEKSLKSGKAFIDYNFPENRCAYLYKYAALHTDLVKRYFLRCLKKKVKNILSSKKHIRICCLGGGPGTDIVGIFKALALIPRFHKRVIKVVILDICQGWKNSFKIIISKLMEGKMDGISAEFFDETKFVAELIEVNLLEIFPINVMEAISTADILCSIKFVSAILKDPASTNALKLITGSLKSGTLFLFIDNKKGEVYKSVENIAEPSGLKIILGPSHQNFGYSLPEKYKTQFKNQPLTGTCVSVLGMLKTEVNTNNCANEILEDLSNTIISADNSWCTESDIYFTDNIVEPISDISDDEENSLDSISKVNKFTQTNGDSSELSVSPKRNLELLFESLDKLFINLDKFFEYSMKRQSCTCHCLRNNC